MKYCFYKEKNGNNKIIITKTQILKIEIYEFIEVFFENENNKKHSIKLIDVNYISDFITNIILNLILI